MRSAGTHVEAYDGVPDVFDLSHGLVSHADLTVPLLRSPAAWALCLEVAEHIPKSKEQALMDNLQRLNCRCDAQERCTQDGRV